MGLRLLPFPAISRFPFNIYSINFINITLIEEISLFKSFFVLQKLKKFE